MFRPINLHQLGLVIKAANCARYKPEWNDIHLQQCDAVVFAFIILELGQDVDVESVGLTKSGISAVHVVAASKDDAKDFSENHESQLSEPNLGDIV